MDEFRNLRSMFTVRFCSETGRLGDIRDKRIMLGWKYILYLVETLIANVHFSNKWGFCSRSMLFPVWTNGGLASNSSHHTHLYQSYTYTVNDPIVVSCHVWRVVSEQQLSRSPERPLMRASAQPLQHLHSFFVDLQRNKHTETRRIAAEEWMCSGVSAHLFVLQTVSRILFSFGEPEQRLLPVIQGQERLPEHQQVFTVEVWVNWGK